MTKNDESNRHQDPSSAPQQQAKRKRKHRKHRQIKPGKQPDRKEQKVDSRRSIDDNEDVKASSIVTSDCQAANVVHQHQSVSETATIRVAEPTTAAPPAPAPALSWDFVFRQAASVEHLGGDLDHDETFRPPAAVVDPGLSQIAQLLLPSTSSQTPMSFASSLKPPPSSATVRESEANDVVTKPSTLEPSPASNSLKQKKLKRKRTASEDAQHVEKKAKKRARSQDDQQIGCDDGNAVDLDPNQQECEDQESCLEGHLIQMSNSAGEDIPTMVLVNRSKGTVYSSVERDEVTGDKIQIGEWKHGKVILWHEQVSSLDVAQTDASATIPGETLDSLFYLTSDQQLNVLVWAVVCQACV